MMEAAHSEVSSNSSPGAASPTDPEEASPLPANWSVICIGAVAPAAWTYARLERLLHEEARLVLKDLEGYAEPTNCATRGSL
jgi:hypothetical protein